MKKLMMGLILSCLALFACGCIDYSELLEINADGTGTMRLQMVMHKSYFEGLMALAEMSDSTADMPDSVFGFMKRKDLEEKAKTSNGKVKLVDFKEIISDSTIAYDIKYAFTDLQEMLAISGDVGQDESMAAPRFKREVKFVKESSGNWSYSRELGDSTMNPFQQPPTGQEAAEVDPEPATAEDSLAEGMAEGMAQGMQDMGDAMMQMLEGAFAGRKVKLAVKFPGDIIESNATSTEGRTATWEYAFMDLFKAPPKLTAVVKP